MKDKKEKSKKVDDDYNENSVNEEKFPLTEKNNDAMENTAGENEYKDLYKRALADYQNLQKQNAKEKEEFARYVKGNLIMEFMPIYENLKAAMEHADENSHDSWLKGVEYVIKQFEDMLANNGVVIINPVDEDFNPYEHEAVEKKETSDKEKNNKIAKVIRQGYKIGSKVMQVARVAVYDAKR